MVLRTVGVMPLGRFLMCAVTVMSLLCAMARFASVVVVTTLVMMYAESEFRLWVMGMLARTLTVMLKGPLFYLVRVLMSEIQMRPLLPRNLLG